MRIMKMAIAIGVGTLSGSSLISSAPAYALQKTEGQTISVKVKGLFCDLCRTKIQKSFKKITTVQKVNVDLENGFVTLIMKKGGNITDKRISKIIKDTGYTPISINRR